jgi:hypothetical protein
MFLADANSHIINLQFRRYPEVIVLGRGTPGYVRLMGRPTKGPDRQADWTGNRL